MGFLSALLGGLCIHCASPEQATTVPKGGLEPRRAIALAAGDGCARLHIKVGPGSTATVTAVDQGSACRADELEVRADSEPVFDAATGVLRLAIVLKNLGTIAMGAPARLTFIADSANLFDQNGNLLPGKPDIAAYNADSANASGRIGVWRYDAYLAPNGQSQVLAAGATSQRRWLEFRSPNWNNAIRISLSASAVEPSPTVVPALPPQNIPKALMDSLGSIVMPSGKLAIPNLLGVRFVLGATQAQRQAAIDAVSGVVVGGWRSLLDESGTYYVLVPAQRSVDLLLDAVDALDAFPQVAGAHILYRDPRDEAAYRRPDDGAGFEHAKWTVRSNAAADTNWALERISAPLAWGCEVGSVGVRVGIVDQSYARGSEVDENEAFFGMLPDSLVFFGAERHGLRVASVLAAPADNSRGIAGVMWRVALDFRDWFANPANYQQRAIDAGITDDLAALEEHIVGAGKAGAKVINLSRSNVWNVAPDTSGTTQASRENRDRIRKAASIVTTALARLRIAGQEPLLVIAAGNNNLDARYSGFNHPARRALDSSQVLVVGGMLQSGQRDDSSNFGSLVSVYAPSRDVAVIKPLEVVTLDGGTSFAAPLVAGTAGLLLSFDPGPHMTPGQIKKLILTGAVDSVTEPNGTKKPILNAYGALKKAAERQGAPLCGNRIWARNGALFAQRGPNDITGEQLIAEVPGTEIAAIDVQHGGRNVYYTAFTGYNTETGTSTPHSAVYSALTGTWSRGPDPFFGLDTASAGAARSYRMQSHDGDTVVTVIAGPDANGAELLGIQLSAGDTVRSTTLTVGTAGLPFTYCSAILLGSCDQTGVGEPLDGFRRVAAAYPPVGDTLLFAVSRLIADTQYVETPGICRGAPCTTIELRYFVSPQRADLYKVSLSSNPFQPVLVRSVSDSIIYYVGYSEDGREKVLSVGRSVDSTAAPVANVPGSFTVLTCRLEWSAPMWTTLAPLYEIAPASACPGAGLAADIGAGTFAPRRITKGLTGAPGQQAKPRKVSTQRRH